MERETDEISLREIIEIVWNGKWIITIVTAIAILISGIVSFIILDPVYEARSTVMVNNQSVEGEEPLLSLQAYREQVKNHAIMRSAITNLNLEDQDITISKLRDKINTEIISDTNLIRITVNDNDPKLTADITNAVTTEFVKFMGSQEIQQLKAQLNYEIKQLEDEIKVTEANLKNIQQELANTPQILVTNKSLSEDAYLQSVVSENNSRSNAETGSIQYRNEELNPTYIYLKESESDLIIELSKFENKKVEIEQSIEENDINVKENLSIVSPAIEPEEPIGPRKLLNMAIAGVVGLMISIMIVFIRNYWNSNISHRQLDHKNYQNLNQ